MLFTLSNSALLDAMRLARVFARSVSSGGWSVFKLWCAPMDQLLHWALFAYVTVLAWHSLLVGALSFLLWPTVSSGILALSQLQVWSSLSVCHITASLCRNALSSPLALLLFLVLVVGLALCGLMKLVLRLFLVEPGAWTREDFVSEAHVLKQNLIELLREKVELEVLPNESYLDIRNSHLWEKLEGECFGRDQNFISRERARLGHDLKQDAISPLDEQIREINADLRRLESLIESIDVLHPTDIPRECIVRLSTHVHWVLKLSPDELKKLELENEQKKNRPCTQRQYNDAMVAIDNLCEHIKDRAGSSKDKQLVLLDTCHAFVSYNVAKVVKKKLGL